MSLQIKKTYHVNDPFVHVDSHTQEEGEEEFVLLEKGAADIAVQAEGEVVVDVDDSLRNVVGTLGVGDATEKDADEPLQRVLVHWVDVGHVSHAEEQDLRVDGDWDVLAASHIDVLFRLLRHKHLGLRCARAKREHFYV